MSGKIPWKYDDEDEGQRARAGAAASRYRKQRLKRALLVALAGLLALGLVAAIIYQFVDFGGVVF